MKSIRTLVVVSDLHAGSRLGLAPAQIKLDDGGYYVPSKEQQVLKSWWDEFWTEFVPRETKGEPYEVVCNGDAVEGVPHGSVSHVSAIMDEHCHAAVDLLRPVVAAPQCSGYWHIRGTEAHVGKSAELEERVARELGAKKSKTGQHARWELWKKLGPHLIHFLHHVGTTGSAAHEASAVNAELTALLTESARWGEKAPDALVRCLSDDTEVLTRGGWKDVTTYVPGEDVMEWHPATGALSWAKPTGYVRNPEEPSMVNIVAKGLDLLVTPDHNMVARARSCKKEAWVYVPAARFIGRSFTVPVSGRYVGAPVSLTPGEAWVLGLFIADGTWVRRGDRVYAMRICQRVSRAPAILAKLESIGIPAKVHAGAGTAGNIRWDIRNGKPVVTRQDCVSVYIANKHLNRFIHHLERDKTLTPALMEMTGEVFEAFWAGLMYGDGADAGGKFFNNNKKLMDQCQELLAKNGYKTKLSCRSWYTRAKDRTVQYCYTLNFTKKTEMQVDQIRKKTHRIDGYRGGSWCVTVPSGCILIRRKGSVAVVGNSHRHRAIEVRVPGPKGWRFACVTPAWQLRTPFAYKVPGARVSSPQIGGVIIRSVDGYLFTIPFVKHIARDDPE